MKTKYLVRVLAADYHFLQDESIAVILEKLESGYLVGGFYDRIKFEKDFTGTVVEQYIDNKDIVQLPESWGNIYVPALAAFYKEWLADHPNLEGIN